MKKVLLIEDDELMLRLYERALQLQNYEVIAVTRGAEGLEKARSEHIDIILLDIMMPEMNGIEVLTELKKDAELEKIPVVILTNLAGTNDKENALSKGAALYVVKSEHEPSDLGSIIEEVVTSHHK